MAGMLGRKAADLYLDDCTIDHPIRRLADPVP
jgi:hypothetical protein